jgi:hypothetical protein
LLEDLGNLGDFIGGLAVVATLIYLAFQIRHNTTSVEAAAVQSAAQSFADIVESFARDPELMKLYLTGETMKAYPRRNDSVSRRSWVRCSIDSRAW